MIIKDINGMYELTVDTSKRIVYEKPNGLWTVDDYLRMHSEYVNKIFPLLKGKTWVKCSDLRDYKTSNIVSEANNHLTACVENGFIGGAIIVDSPIVKMQMNRASKDTGLKLGPVAFTDPKEAEQWIASQQF